MSASANKDRYYAASIVGKSRRSSPGDSQGNPYSFQATGQGPYSNAYNAPRSSPGRGYDINPQAFYATQWPTGNSPPLTPAFPNYDTTSGHAHERHSPQPSYSAYSTTSRASPPLMNHTDPRRLPPLTTSSSPGGDRWQQSAGYGMPAVHGYHHQTGNSIRSPTAGYPPQYTTYPGGSQGSAYTYNIPGYDHVPINQPLFDDMDQVHIQPRSTSPYTRTHGPSQASSANFTPPPPVSPTSPDEPTIKKKRKRADAAQLKVLNETYARTAFPSTEERHSLAKALDMSARSVQIWFQNKRQSMRQTNRQSSTVSGSSHQQQFGMHGSQMDDMAHLSSNYSGGSIPLTEPTYMPASSVQDMGRSHASHSSSSHRRVRGPEEGDSQRWPRGY